MLEDTDGDGMPDELPDDYPDSGLPPYDLVEDLDDDADGTPDVDEANNGQIRSIRTAMVMVSVMVLAQLMAYVMLVQIHIHLTQTCR